MKIVCTIIAPRPLASADYRRILDARLVGFSVVLLGSAPESDNVRANLLRLALADVVLIAGTTPPEALARIMGADDVRTL